MGALTGDGKAPVGAEPSPFRAGAVSPRATPRTLTTL
ncbi:MAG: hypothetical protein JCHSAcid_16140 [uncultured Acidilobus sp. JCHS]|nr:MAG: hypothetical protein JCHSAcid_16140 [uncultured Acidilobus sp. JCHS]